ncbi:MAG: hypothetical protein ABEI86_10995, partial [Halobacteriaceae archaeon]
AMVEEEEETQPMVNTVENESSGANAVEEVSPSENVLEEEWPDPLELILGSGGGEVSSDEPIVICVGDKDREDFVAVLETLVQRLYREKVGGQPDPNRFGDAEELVDETRWVEAEDKIFTAKFGDDEWDKLEDELKENWERILENRVLNELYAQNFGAIIFNRLHLLSPEDHHPKIISLTPSSPSTTTEENLIRLFWGYWDDAISVEDKTFGQLFNLYGERLIEDQWTKIENDENGIFLDAAEPDETAGHHHRRMKVLVIKWLVDRLRDQGYDLETPTEIKSIIEPEKEYNTLLHSQD